jgi:dienelactone hydrolase
VIDADNLHALDMRYLPVTDMRARLCFLLLAACVACRSDSPKPGACDGANLLAAPSDLATRGPWPVGVRTVTFDGVAVEVWYPADPSGPGSAETRYDLRTAMPAAEAAKIPDAENAWLVAACTRDLAIDAGHGPYPIVVFLHGAASFRAQSAFLTTHWASRGFVVIAPDLPGVGLAQVLSGVGTGYPLMFPNQLLDAVVKPRADDPFAFVRSRMSARIGIVGHSLGAMLINSLDARTEISVRVGLAGLLTYPGKHGSLLTVSGETDGIAGPDRDPKALQSALPPARRAIIRGAGHLAFTDLCTVGADRGGALAIAKAHGVNVPDMIAMLATDGCRPTDAPFETTKGPIRAITTGVLEETLRCDPGKAAAIRQLAGRDIDLLEKLK